MLIVLVCFNLILAFSFVVVFSNPFLYSCHAQQDQTGHVITLYLLTKVMNWVQTLDFYSFIFGRHNCEKYLQFKNKMLAGDGYG
jgi:hypothetical protein